MYAYILITAPNGLKESPEESEEHLKSCTMKTKYKNKLLMYKSVLTIINDYQSSWSVLPAFEGVKNALEEKVAQLEAHRTDQTVVAKGAGKIKRERREELGALFMTAIKALKAYASVTENTELFMKMQFAPSRLLYGSTAEMLTLTSFTMDKVEEHQSALEDYGITEELFNTLVDAQGELDKAMGNPRVRIVERKHLTGEIHHLVAEIDKLIQRQLDMLVGVLESTDRAFHSRYFNARKIVHYKATKSSSDEASPKAPEEPDEGESGSAA